MNVPASPQPALIDSATLAAQLPVSTPVLLALDFDGTLAPIVNNPAAATLLPEAAKALHQLPKDTVIAVVSGRPLHELTERFGALRNVMLIGGHGQTVRDTDGTVHNLATTTVTAELCQQISDTLARIAPAADGWLIEAKPSGVAVHHRNVADRLVTAGRKHVLRAMQAHVASGTFRLLHGHCVDELVLTTATKGDALTWLINRFPQHTPVAVGDDTTDEEMFVIARRHGGTGILVADAPRESGAFYRVITPADVASFLTLFAARISATRR